MIRSWLWAGFALSWVLKSSMSMAACPELSDFLEAQKSSSARLWDARNTSARRVLEGFFSRSIEFSEIERCLIGNPQRQDFLDTLQAHFFRTSIERLRGSGLAEVKAMLAIYDLRASAGHLPLFRFTGHSEHSPAPYRAGANRKNGSIYMELGRIDPSEWYILFIHELLHSLDPMTADASTRFSQREKAASYEKLALTIKSPNALSPASREEIMDWLEAGLNRGLWSEYRAWVSTFAIYQAGLRADQSRFPLWGKISWMDEVLKEKREGESLRSFLFRYLDPRMKSPDDGLFASRLFQALIVELRQSYRDDGRPLPTLGVFEEIDRVDRQRTNP